MSAVPDMKDQLHILAEVNERSNEKTAVQICRDAIARIEELEARSMEEYWHTAASILEVEVETLRKRVAELEVQLAEAEGARIIFVNPYEHDQ